MNNMFFFKYSILFLIDLHHKLLVDDKTWVFSQPLEEWFRDFSNLFYFVFQYWLSKTINKRLSNNFLFVKQIWHCILHYRLLTSQLLMFVRLMINDMKSVIFLMFTMVPLLISATTCVCLVWCLYCSPMQQTFTALINNQNYYKRNYNSICWYNPRCQEWHDMSDDLTRSNYNKRIISFHVELTVVRPIFYSYLFQIFIRFAQYIDCAIENKIFRHYLKLKEKLWILI